MDYAPSAYAHGMTPIVFTSLKKAVAENKGLPIFNEERRPNDNRRRYVESSFPEYFKTFTERDSNLRRTHEHIRTNFPCKIFYDLEEYDGTKEDMDATVLHVVSETQKALAGNPNIPVPLPVPYIVFDGSRTGKQSRHVIFQIFCKNSMCVQAFVGRIRNKLHPDMSKRVDIGVYPYERCFRMPFSHGCGKSKLLWADHPETDFDLAAFCMGCITFFRKPAHINAPPELTLLNYDPLYVDFEIDVISTGPSIDKGWSSEEVRTMIRSLRKHFSKNIVASSLEGENIQLILKGIVCPNKGKAHNSNKTYLHVKIPFRMPVGEYKWDISCPSTFCCADTADCGKFHWKGPDFADLCIAPLLQAELDAANESGDDGEMEVDSKRDEVKQGMDVEQPSNQT